MFSFKFSVTAFIVESNKFEYCNKTFYNSSTRQRHIKTIHQQTVEDTTMNHIICPLCKEEIVRTFLEFLNKQSNYISIDKICLTFFHRNGYQNWADNEKLEVNYVHCSTNKIKDQTEVCYMCNYSNEKTYFFNDRVSV